MNDPLYALRSYDCEKSRASRDRWITWRISAGMPVVQHLDRFGGVPVGFAKQWDAARAGK